MNIKLCNRFLKNFGHCLSFERDEVKGFLLFVIKLKFGFIFISILITYLLSTFSQIYWEECYQTELANFEDHGDVGEVWFGEDSALRMVKWLVGHPDLVAPGSSILDSGTGTLKKVGIPFCIVLYADILPLSCLPSSFASLDCFLCYLIFLNLFPIFGHN